MCCLLGAGVSTVFLLAASTAPGLVLPLPGPDPFIAEFFRLSAAFPPPPPPVDATVGDGLGRWGVLGSCTELDLFRGRGGCFAPVEPCDRGGGLGPNFMRCDTAGEAWVAICSGDTEAGNERIGRRSIFQGRLMAIASDQAVCRAIKHRQAEEPPPRGIGGVQSVGGSVRRREVRPIGSTQGEIRDSRGSGVRACVLCVSSRLAT